MYLKTSLILRSFYSSKNPEKGIIFLFHNFHKNMKPFLTTKLNASTVFNIDNKKCILSTKSAY